MYKLLLFAAVMITGCSEQMSGPVIIAHRGASHDAPENTLPAFLLAWEQGADAIETDVYLTSDGEIVCFHDETTKRVTGVDIVVRNATLEELRALDAGQWKGEPWSGAVIPTLGEVFQLVPRGKKILVEIKSGAEILPVLYEEIDKSPLRKEQIVIISFNRDVIKEFKSSRPDYKALWLSGFSTNEDGILIPEVGTVLEILADIGADGFSSNFQFTTSDYIDPVREAGYEYHVWTVNDPLVALELWQNGVQSIITDRPGLFKEYFDNRQQNSEN